MGSLKSVRLELARTREQPEGDSDCGYEFIAPLDDRGHLHEPIFKFDRHAFVPGEYVSITEHDGVTRPFRVVSVTG
jgi:hypothetical protein